MKVQAVICGELYEFTNYVKHISGKSPEAKVTILHGGAVIIDGTKYVAVTKIDDTRGVYFDSVKRVSFNVPYNIINAAINRVRT